jgi:iduronate 2-sulfatase
LWCKHTNYEQAARNPLIISAPGKVKGERTKSLAATIDIYPTLCDLAGIKAPSDLPGLSLVPVLNDPKAAVQDSVVHVYPRGFEGKPILGRAVRDARWRYVEWRQFNAERTLVGEELYDLEQDPQETKNVAGKSEHAAIQKALATKIAALEPALPQHK